jgi:hypothetical protein
MAGRRLFARSIKDGFQGLFGHLLREETGQVMRAFAVQVAAPSQVYDRLL